MLIEIAEEGRDLSIDIGSGEAKGEEGLANWF